MFAAMDIAMGMPISIATPIPIDMVMFISLTKSGAIGLDCKPIAIYGIAMPWIQQWPW